MILSLRLTKTLFVVGNDKEGKLFHAMVMAIQRQDPNVVGTLEQN